MGHQRSRRRGRKPPAPPRTGTMTDRGGSIVNLNIHRRHPGRRRRHDVPRVARRRIIHFTKCAAIDLAPYEIRVNCLAPGHIRTGIVASSAQGMDAEKWPSSRPASGADACRPAHWSGGDREDVAEAVLFSPATAPYITGTVLPSTAARRRASRTRRGQAAILNQALDLKRGPELTGTR